MASEVSISNRALQKLGANRITSFEETSRNANACKAVYPSVRDSVLRAHPWSCATRRYVLPAEANKPAFGGYNSFPLPSEVLRPLPPDRGQSFLDLEWQVEERRILASEAGPLRIRAIYRVTDPNLFDACLAEVIACKMAIELCEELTQSNTKKQALKEDYKEELKEARRTNAIEKPSETPPEDTWMTSRIV